MNEKTEETVKNKATIEVNSSTKLNCDLLVKCKDVITNKQNPKRLADVFKIC